MQDGDAGTWGPGSAGNTKTGGSGQLAPDPGKRQRGRRSLGAADEEPLRRRLCYRGAKGSPVRERIRKEGTEKRYDDLLVVGKPGDDELQKAAS